MLLLVLVEAVAWTSLVSKACRHERLSTMLAWILLIYEVDTFGKLLFQVLKPRLAFFLLHLIHFFILREQICYLMFTLKQFVLTLRFVVSFAGCIFLHQPIKFTLMLFLDDFELVAEVCLCLVEDDSLLQPYLVAEYLHYFIFHCLVHLSKVLLHPCLQYFMLHLKLCVVLLQIFNLCLHQGADALSFANRSSILLLIYLHLIQYYGLLNICLTYSIIQLLMQSHKLIFLLDIEINKFLYSLLEIRSDIHHVLIACVFFI